MQPGTGGWLVDLEQTLTRYLAQGKDREGHQSEIARFIRWCGRQREVESLTAEEVAEYVQFSAGSSTDSQRRLEPVREFLAFAHRRGFIKSNLSSHIRAPKGRGRPKRIAGSGAAQEYALTPEGIALLQERLDLLREERPRTTDEIRKAAADKDVRENAPLEAARERQGHIDARIRELERLLRSAATTQAQGGQGPDTRVAPGKRVLLRNIVSGAEQSYILVAPAEANPMNGRLSLTSPVGKALLDREVEEKVEVPTPRGTETFLIIAVE